MFCSNCAETIADEAFSCPKCGQPTRRGAATMTIGGKSRVTAGILAILIGGLGVHKFYLGKAGLGILYLVFCWTFIPAIVALIEGIIYLTQDDETFFVKQGLAPAGR